ncbi:plasmid mobilization protein [Granulicella tundricola]|uniref:Uncharacterized protein n=1 Tax=Granulicella tundricola (strain ATCC BAA-1859 / DSM 23138 / MP5ACTX9) TaxID=1198114 RepID=E8X7G7_GRATM|nr:hypothetical protein [Granulicella tundricola]ADW71401.1 hypothetical protein AciX9_4455 [Granulicella tundricola MP5ACTX9]
MNATEATKHLGIGERIRRSSGRAGRRTVASTKVTLQEHAELEAAAKQEGKVLSEWAREVLLEKARTGPTGTAVFTELIALRLLANNVLRSIALGKVMTEKEYAQVLSEVKNGKRITAAEILTQYRNQEGVQ